MFETHYDGPTTISTFSFGGKAVKLLHPTDPERLLDDARVIELNRRDDYMPYWGFLWPGAFLLAEAVASRGWEPGTEALELGCGLGLAGLVGIASGLDVEFTDYDEAPLRFVARSASANGFGPARFRTRLLDWREPDGPRVPVILGADVLYEKRLIPLVCGVIRSRLTPDGEAMIAGPYRMATEDLAERMKEFGLMAKSESMVANDLAGKPVRGTLHRIRIAPVVREPL